MEWLIAWVAVCAVIVLLFARAKRQSCECCAHGEHVPDTVPEAWSREFHENNVWVDDPEIPSW